MKKTIAGLLLLFLYGCSSQPIRTEYIKCEIPPLPEKPTYFKTAPVEKDRGYYFDEQGFKNLIKNILIDKGYQKDLRTILEQLKGDIK